jgi:integrase
MSVVPRKLDTGGISYWVVFAWQGKRVWERSGPDRRAADRLDERRQREVKAGTYVPPRSRTATTFGQFAKTWAEKRKNRNALDELRALEKYVFTRDWLMNLPLAEVRAGQIFQLVSELKQTISDTTKKALSPKTVANIFGSVRTMFRDARLADLMTADPCVLPRGTFSRRAKKRRLPYELAEIRSLLSEPVEPDAQMFNALAFFTGMREGEVCGRRWRDYDDAALPLGALMIETQYEDRVLKTEEAGGEQSRVAPVHPALATMLEWWWEEGFEQAYCRRPTKEDFIVPHRDEKGARAHTKSTAYKMWRRSCLAAGVTNRSLHSVRHTFISMCRRHGARKEVVERITHNATGDIVDSYTTWDWTPLCEAVQLLTPVLTGVTEHRENKWRRRESKPVLVVSKSINLR